MNMQVTPKDLAASASSDRDRLEPIVTAALLCLVEEIASDRQALERFWAMADRAGKTPGVAKDLSAHDPDLKAQVAGLVRVLLVHRQPGASAGQGGLAAWQLQRAIAAIDADLAAPMPLGDLAAIAGLSPKHFSRAFRRSTGMPPKRWILHRRIEVARHLLITTAMPLAEIACACGFADQSHMTSVFTKMIGRSPGSFRRAHGACAPAARHADLAVAQHALDQARP